MINTWRCRNYDSLWYQLLFLFRHPIAFIRTFKEEMYAWPSLPNTIRKQWMKIYTRLPFQKACRWLGHELIYRVYDNKILDTFECRTRGKITKYYYADCAFGRIKFFEKTYIRNGKTCNIFFDCFVTTLVDEEKGKKNATETKTKVKTIYKGWVFTKKKAFRLLRDIIKKNSKIFTGEYKTYPEAAESYLVKLTDNMFSILRTGKFDDENLIDQIHLAEIYKNNKDHIVRLWAYLSHLLSCPNDFNAHYEISQLALICNGYVFDKIRLKDPTIDNFYMNLIKDGKEKQAKKYLREIRKDNKYYKEEAYKRLEKDIQELRNKYLTMPYEYYRC